MKIEKLRIKVEHLFLEGSAYWPEKGTAQGKSPFLILCHGIPAGKRSLADGEQEVQDGGYPALAARCCREGLPVFHFNFRGTGESGGNFDLLGWTRDLEAILNYWEDHGQVNGFYLWGFSAGASVSAFVAAKEQRIKAVVLAACPFQFDFLFTPEDLDKTIAWFKEIGIIREKAFPFNRRQWLHHIYKLNPSQYIAGIAPRPLLIVHGTGDELIPYRQAEQLYELAGNPKELYLIPGAKHQLRKEPKAIDKCLRWIKQI